MILTIQAPSKALYRAGLWEASMMMGLEVEAQEGNTFEVIVHDKGKADRILQVTQGRVIHQQ